MQAPHAPILLAVAALALAAQAQSILKSQTGSSGWRYGQAMLQTADQNGDGYPDVLVGAPGANNQGSLRCLSGKYLATSTGPVELWSLSPALGNAANFGAAIAEVGTLTGNSATDYVVGAPGSMVGAPHGALFLVDGSTHTIAAAITGQFGMELGATVVAVGDQDGDGKVEVAASAPYGSCCLSYVHVISGASFASSSSLQNTQHASFSVTASTQLGQALASGFDLDHDGRFDLAIGAPESGNAFVLVCRADFSFDVLATYTSSQSNDLMGSAIDGTQDFDGDGTNDLVVGAPGWDAGGSTNNAGRAVCLSGSRLAAATLPFELLEMQFAPSSVGNSNLQFGTSVCASSDLNGDAVPDIVVGGPGHQGLFPPNANRGSACMFSGATGMRFGIVIGQTNDRLGDALLACPNDLNGDSFRDFAVAGSMCGNPSLQCGVVKFLSLFPAQLTTYCTAKTNSLGCAPSVTYAGSPSATSSQPFSVQCFNQINQKMGLLTYSHAPNAAPFQGGTLCIEPPLKRSGTMNSGGNASGVDCTGMFDFDMKTRIQSGVDPTLVVGADIHCQFWSRDPGAASVTSLSNALRFLINP